MPSPSGLLVGSSGIMESSDGREDQSNFSAGQNCANSGGMSRNPQRLWKAAEKELSTISLALDSALTQNVARVCPRRAKNRSSGSLFRNLFTVTYAAYRIPWMAFGGLMPHRGQIPVLHPLRNQRCGSRGHCWSSPRSFHRAHASGHFRD